MNSSAAGALASGLRRTLGPQWVFSVHDGHLEINHKLAATPYHPPKAALGWQEALTRMQETVAGYGIHRDRPLPIRLRRETDLTISAVQAADPYLKECRPVMLRQGFIAQPVVRQSARRDASGALLPGYLTSFVNVSVVRPVEAPGAAAESADMWISLISSLGLHARHVTICGSLATWRRREVSGITLRLKHCDRTIGDLVLLWNAQRPEYSVSDLGSGLERILWARAQTDWAELVFGARPSVHWNTLDALRTATLVFGSGIAPSSRGAGAAGRRMARIVSQSNPVTLPLGRHVRAAHAFWSLTTDLQQPWHEVSRTIEEEIAHARPNGSPRRRLGC